MTEQDGYGLEIDCLMLIDADDDTINELWAQAEINVLTNEQE